MAERFPSRREFLLATGLAGVAAGAAGPADAQRNYQETWHQYSGDAANTSFAPDNTGPTAPVSEAWQLRGRSGNRIVTAGSPPVVDGGRVFATLFYAKSADELKPYVTAVSAVDGSLLWRRRSGVDGSFAPVVGQDRVYTRPASEPTLTARSKQDGTEVWSKSLSEFDAEWWRGSGGSGRIAHANGSLYLADRGRLVAFRRDGSRKWTFEPDRSGFDLFGLLGSAVRDGSAYLTAVGKNVDKRQASSDVSVHTAEATVLVYAVDTSDGTKRWRATVSDLRYAHLGPPVVGPEKVFVAFHAAEINSEESQGQMLALGTENGTKQWQKVLPELFGVPALANDQLFVPGFEHLVGLASTDGTERWRKRFPHLVTDVVGTDDSVYTVTKDGGVYGLSREGKIRWRIEGGSFVSYAIAHGQPTSISSPLTGPNTAVAVANGGLFVAKDRGLTAFGPNGTIPGGNGGSRMSGTPGTEEPTSAVNGPANQSDNGFPTLPVLAGGTALVGGTLAAVLYRHRDDDDDQGSTAREPAGDQANSGGAIGAGRAPAASPRHRRGLLLANVDGPIVCRVRVRTREGTVFQQDFDLSRGEERELGQLPADEPVEVGVAIKGGPTKTETFRPEQCREGVRVSVEPDAAAVTPLDPP